jgi:hypothetical protein
LILSLVNSPSASTAVVTFGFGELDVLAPAYAVTQHYPMLQRNLLYTGVTRGRRLVVLVGQKKAVAIAVGNARAGDVGRNLTSG